MILTIAQILSPPYNQRMKAFWRTVLALLLTVQATALPIHAFAEEMQHAALQGSASIHDHSHHHAHEADEGVNGDMPEGEAAHPHDHGCVSNCHAPVALLGNTARSLQKNKLRIASYIATWHSLRIIEPIERPQWRAARAERAADIAS